MNKICDINRTEKARKTLDKMFSGGIFSIFMNMKKIILLLLPVILVISGAAAISYSEADKTPAEDAGITEDVIEPPPLPKTGLSFDKEFHNFGQVIMGEKVKTVYRFKNTSDKLIKITDMISSCGCTVADLTKFDYAPNEEGDIIVTLDTTLKEGLITKTITLKTDFPSRSEIHLSLAARVKMPPHPDEKSVEIIMSDKCRLCHIEAGKDLAGGYLYHKVCWQCHGDPMHKPKTINIFDSGFLKARTDDELYNAVAKGIPGTGMPKYLDKEQGRGLTEEQIRSLVEFIRSNEKKGE